MAARAFRPVLPLPAPLRAQAGRDRRALDAADS